MRRVAKQRWSASMTCRALPAFLLSAEECIPKAVLRPGCIHRATNFGWVGRLDLEKYKGWPVHLPDEGGGLGNFSLVGDGSHYRDTSSRGDDGEIYPKRGVALLIARLAV